MEAGAVKYAEEAAAEGINVFGDAMSGTYSKTFPTTRPPPSSCWSTTGRFRCGTRSPARAASGSATASSALSTWWPSG
jgi:hypothetical protein